jgi:class 3 adenylate cyclase
VSARAAEAAGPLDGIRVLDCSTGIAGPLAAMVFADFGAEVVKMLGDGLMLRCRQADNAVRLGLKIVDELATVPDFPYVRVGMHTGPAVTRDGDWYGTTVNVAARLCGAASGGEVLVSDATTDAAGALRGVEVGEHRLHWLKNLSEPVGAHSVSPQECDEGRLRRLRSLLGAKMTRFQEAV